MGENNKTWLNVSCKTVFIYLSGKPQRVRPGSTVTGVISKDTQKDFKLIDTPKTVIEEPVTHEQEPVVELTNPQLKAKITEKGGKYPSVVNKAQLKEILAKLEADVDNEGDDQSTEESTEDSSETEQNDDDQSSDKEK